MLKVSDMAENLIGSEIIKLAGEIKEKMNKGEKIYNFTIGDFDPKIFPIPAALKKHIIEAYQNDETNYPPANGVPELRKAVSRFIHTRGQLEYNDNQILIASGARPLIYSIFQTVVDPGDTVVFPVPSWNNNHYTHLSRGTQVFVETSAENNFMPSAADLKPYISKATLIALCSPLNPTGTTFRPEQLEEICDLIIEENRKRGDYKKPVYLMYDQIYWTLTYGTTTHVDPVHLKPEMKNYTIYVDGLSKAFAATGVRVGWAFGPQKIIDKMKSILGHVGAWAPKAEQVASAKFMNDDAAVDTYLFWLKNEIETRLTSLYRGIAELKQMGFPVNAIEPRASIYLTLKIDLVGKTTEKGKKITSAEETTQYLLDDAKIALVPFYAFGSSKTSPWYRLSVGTCSMNDVQGFLSNLRASLSKFS